MNIKKNRYELAILVAVMFFVVFFSSGVKVCAATLYTDKEPNNNVQGAQYISRNAQTPRQAVSGSTSSYRSVTGNLDSGDEDWYEVSLYTTNDAYLDIGGGSSTILIDVYDSNMQLMDTFQYQKYGQTHVYQINFVDNGNYYIRLYHTNNYSQNYNFTVGNPKYNLDSYVHKFKSITLSKGEIWNDTVNLANVSSIPNGAIGYEINIGGCSSSVSRKRDFYNEFYNTWVATKTTYSYDLPVTQSSLLDQKWGAQIQLTGTSKTTFSPTMSIKYVYPNLP